MLRQDGVASCSEKNSPRQDWGMAIYSYGRLLGGWGRRSFEAWSLRPIWELWWDLPLKIDDKNQSLAFKKGVHDLWALQWRRLGSRSGPYLKRPHVFRDTSMISWPAAVTTSVDLGVWAPFQIKPLKFRPPRHEGALENNHCCLATWPSGAPASLLRGVSIFWICLH